MKRVTPIKVLFPAVLILVSGCATKNWVREALDQRQGLITQDINQREAQTTQRVTAVDSRVSEQGQRVESMVGRIGAVETSVGEASATAAGARDLGNTALGRADGVDRRLTRLWSNRYSPKIVDSVDVLFGFDRSDLDDGAQTALLGIVKELQGNPGLTVELVGYADPKGPREYNVQLSQRRMEAVRRFLVEKGIQVARIQGVGLGPIQASQGPDARKRRVTAKLMIDQD